MTRTFLALELEPSQQQFLGTIIRQGKLLLPALRWVEPASIHLTLAFLGELGASQLEQAMGAARSAAATGAPFAYRLSGLGTFGPPRQPRVLWMGVSEPSGALRRVHRALTSALGEQGFAGEQRSFSPHLTLARIAGPLTSEQLQQLQQLLSRYRFSTTAYRIGHLSVMKSELAPSGARYTCLQRYTFARSQAHSRPLCAEEEDG
ncbi:MAG TPA: RNA 2',3'-cyclic phosphodiesterase [Ktedonobacteraceae bacterium]|jgi:2'-5' RNA ligase